MTSFSKTSLHFNYENSFLFAASFHYFLLSSFAKTQDVLILHTIISSLVLIAKVDAGDSKGERRGKKKKTKTERNSVHLTAADSRLWLRD